MVNIAHILYIVYIDYFLTAVIYLFIPTEALRVVWDPHSGLVKETTILTPYIVKFRYMKSKKEGS